MRLLRASAPHPRETRLLMFATLLGDLPRPPLPADAPAEAIVRAAVEAQVAAGLEPVTDGGWWGTLSPVTAWQRTSALTDRLVKQAMLGPYSTVETVSAHGRVGLRERREALTAAARSANATLLELAAAGCPFIEVHEPRLPGIGDDPAAWAQVAELFAAMTDGVTGTHLSLAITGGAIPVAGHAAVLAAPFASFGLDLIAGPENWRLVRAAASDRGIVCGAMGAGADADEGPEILLWAAAYAASSDGRGRDRVGLSTSSSLATLPWDVAVRKLDRLGAAVELAGRPVDELRSGLDPRSIDVRTAALGHGPPPARNPPRRRGP